MIRRSLISTMLLLLITLSTSAADLYQQARNNYQDSTIAFPLLDKYDRSARGNDQGNSYFLRGYIYKQYGIRDVASLYYMKALQHYDEDAEVSASVLNELGILFLESSSPDIAIRYFKKAQNIWGDSDYYQAIANLKIGQCYFFNNDMKKALYHYEESLNHSNKNYSYKLKKDTLATGDRLRVYEALTELATLKYNQKYYHMAIKHNEDARIYATNTFDSARVYNDIGNAYLALSDMELSKMYLDSALHLKKKAGVENLYTYYNLGRYYLIQKDTTLAIDLFRTAIASNTKTYVDQDLADSYVQLKKLLYAKGNIELYASYSLDLDEILIGHINEAKDLERQVDILMMDRSRRKVIQEQQQQRQLYQYIGWGSLALAVILSLVVYIIYYRRRLAQHADVSEGLVPEGHKHLVTNMRVIKSNRDEYKHQANTWKRMWEKERKKNKDD